MRTGCSVCTQRGRLLVCFFPALGRLYYYTRRWSRGEASEYGAYNIRSVQLYSQHRNRYVGIVVAVKTTYTSYDNISSAAKRVRIAYERKIERKNKENPREGDENNNNNKKKNP